MILAKILVAAVNCLSVLITIGGLILPKYKDNSKVKVRFFAFSLFYLVLSVIDILNSNAKHQEIINENDVYSNIRYEAELHDQLTRNYEKSTLTQFLYISVSFIILIVLLVFIFKIDNRLVKRLKYAISVLVMLLVSITIFLPACCTVVRRDSTLAGGIYEVKNSTVVIYNNGIPETICESQTVIIGYAESVQKSEEKAFNGIMLLVLVTGELAVLGALILSEHLQHEITNTMAKPDSKEGQ